MQKANVIVTAVDIGFKIAGVVSPDKDKPKKPSTCKGDTSCPEEYIPELPKSQSNQKDEKLAIRYFQEGELNRKSGKLAEASEFYQKAIEQHNSKSIYWQRYGWALLSLKKFKSAERVLIEAIRRGGNQYTYEQLGKVYLAQNNKVKAKEAFEKALSLDRSMSSARAKIDEINTAIVNETKRSIQQKSNKRTQPEPQAKYFVEASPSLTLRTSPVIAENNKLKSLPNGSMVELLNFVGETTEIDSKKSKWARIQHNGQIGYVFGGYLRKQ